MNSVSAKKIKKINLDFETFETLIDSYPTAVIIDVRTIMEFNQGRIANSILIDFSNSEFLHKIEQLDKTKKYLVYCRSGNRSYYAILEMLRAGFEDVAHLASGIIGWKGEIEY